MLPDVRTILYSTDLSPYAPKVFRHAMGLAQKYEARIVIVHALEPLPPSAQSLLELYLPPERSSEIKAESREALVDEIRKRLELFCDKELCVDPAGRNRVTEIRILEGRPAEVVLEEAKRVAADLIVMGSHGHTAVGEILLGATAHQVIQRATAPVLLVRLRAADAEPGP
jgi:nucleotide-binding universal stress UspA family protein